MKKVAVVMINYRNYGEKFFQEAADSLRQQTYPFKLFIVDNSSTIESREFIKQTAPEAEMIINEGEWINQGNNGYALGNNQAFKKAIEQGFDYVVAANMDTVFDKNWLKYLVEAADSNEQIGAVQAKMMMYEDKTKINSTGNRIHFLGFGYCEDYDAKNYEIKDYKKINYASGCSVLYKADVLKEVGMYDENFFMYHEDTDLSWRMWQAGYQVILASKAIMYHKYEFNRSILQFYYMERNRFLIILTNYELSTLFLILPALFLMEIGLFIFSIKNRLWRTKLKVYGFFLTPANWRIICASRKVKQNHRKVGDREVVKNFSGKLEFQEVDNWMLRYVGNPFFDFYWAVVKRLI